MTTSVCYPKKACSFNMTEGPFTVSKQQPHTARFLNFIFKSGILNQVLFKRSSEYIHKMAQCHRVVIECISHLLTNSLANKL